MERAEENLDVLSAPGGAAAGAGAPGGGYQYRHGDRPLEGYTIQRAIGRGGFGEVYFAVSDAGRQVALKAINTYEQIELRGVSQCMNLKSPHLVTIFDVRHSAAGRPFVIMEHVAGPSLAEIIADSPGGLGPQKSAFFLREIGKGLTFLHEAGIVHRDLKPGNVFFEDGYVKIGDYGLSKAIAASARGGQTITVGTVHYMAPEIGQGNYDRGVDIYALGVVLYEMLTGRTPYVGDSIGEILMKHLSARPDLTSVAEPFAGTIRRAMEKDPSARFRSVQEMVENVFGTAYVRNSVSLFAPNTLTMVAGRAADHLPAHAPQPPPTPAGPPPTLNPQSAIPDPQSAAGDVRGAGPPPLPASPRVPHASGGEGQTGSPDPVTPTQRYVLALVAVAIMAFGTALLAGGSRGDMGLLVRLEEAAMMILGAAAGAALARRWLSLPSDSPMLWRLGYGTLACAAAAVPTVALAVGFQRWLRPAGSEALLATLGAVCIVLFLLDWRKLADPRRKDRISLRYALVGGLAAGAIAAAMEGMEVLAGGVLAGIALSVQVASEHLRKAAPDQPAPRRHGHRGH